MDLFQELFRPAATALETNSHNFTVRHEDTRTHSAAAASSASGGHGHHHRSTWTTALLLVSLCIVAAWIFLMNSAVIYGILKKPKTERCATDYYYMNLSAIDVLDGCLTLPFMGLTLIQGDFLVGFWWCHAWIFLDYSLIIGCSIGLMGLMLNYFWMVRRPCEYKQISNGQHKLLIILMWVVTIVMWMPAFLHNYMIDTILGSCGFDITINRYYTLYIGIVAFYFPLIICTASVLYSTFILRKEAYDRLFYPVRKPNGAAAHILAMEKVTRVPTGDEGLGQLQLQLQRLRLTRVWSQNVIFETNHILKYQRHAKQELPLVLSLLALFILSRTIYYVYFGVGAFIPSIFPRDLFHSVYWILQIQGCFAPLIHIRFDQELRYSIQRNLFSNCCSRRRERARKKSQSQNQLALLLKTVPISNNNIIMVKPILNLNGK